MNLYGLIGLAKDMAFSSDVISTLRRIGQSDSVEVVVSCVIEEVDSLLESCDLSPAEAVMWKRALLADLKSHVLEQSAKLAALNEVDPDFSAVM